MIERQKRLNDILDKYYLELKKNDELPSEENFDISKIPEAISDCFLVNIYDSNSSQLKMSVSFIGDNIIEAFGNESLSSGVESLIDVNNIIIFRKFEELLKTKTPLEDEGEFINSKGINLKYRLKIFPLTDRKGGENVKFIFGGMRWKKEF